MNWILRNKFWLHTLPATVFLLLTSLALFSQSKVSNKYGLLVIKDINILQKEIKLNPNKRMVDLRKFIPGISLDLKYATKDNFMHQRLYPRIKTTYLREPAAVALKRAATELGKLNLGIKIFDAYRPYSVTEKMWEVVKDDRYAANPATGSGHNRGASVDLTLIDLMTKKEFQARFIRINQTPNSELPNSFIWHPMHTYKK